MIRYHQFSHTALLYLAVATGSVIGGVSRAVVSLAALAWAGPLFPWGTLSVNIIGSFAIGFYAAIAGQGGRMPAGIHQYQFVTTGLCGGFTTFSMFSLEMFQFLHDGSSRLAGLYVVLSLTSWIASAWVGLRLGRHFNQSGQGKP